MDIDRPLEEIIDEKRTERRKSGRGGRGRGQRGAVRGGGAGRGGFNAAPAAVIVPVTAAGSVGPVRNKYSGNIAATQGGAGKAAATAALPLMADGAKVIVSNLPTDVTENQVRDLFSQTVGPVTKLSLSYDKNGKSTGVATIELRRPGDGQVAYNTYNGRLVDGNRPMKVEILFDPTRLPPPPLNSRIAPAPAVAQVATIAVAASGAPRGARGGAGGRGRGTRGRGRGGARKKDDRKEVNEGDLDAEMEEYQKGLSATA